MKLSINLPKTVVIDLRNTINESLGERESISTTITDELELLIKSYDEYSNDEDVSLWAYDCYQKLKQIINV
jgi:hypothetical protein